jgi:polysaccharide deacetylase family protein (PEP-CTERM system associated)
VAPCFEGEWLILAKADADNLLPMNTTVTNAMTVDVEDYFQVSALAPYIERRDWSSIPCRVERNVDRLLELFDATGAKCTFFTLGWIAERYPSLVRKIVAAGHELASHGYGHLRASEQSAEEFEQDVTGAKRLLEDLGGVSVIGYRAPSFSIGAGNEWTFDVLANAGYRYSSSVYPVRHDHYGHPDAPRFAYKARTGFIEIPITTIQLLGRNLPAGGGGYFRLFPYLLSSALISHFNRVESKAAIFYMHPWEIDPGQPRIAGTNLKTRFRHYLNLNRTERRLARLLRDFEWGRMDHVFGAALDTPASEQLLRI